MPGDSHQQRHNQQQFPVKPQQPEGGTTGEATSSRPSTPAPRPAERAPTQPGLDRQLAANATMGDGQSHRDDFGSDQNHQEHDDDEEQQEEEEEEQQRQQLQVLVTETVQQLERERLEEEEREERLLALRNLPPEEYLQQTGVSVAMDEALGVVAALRPANPLSLFSDM